MPERFTCLTLAPSALALRVSPKFCRYPVEFLPDTSYRYSIDEVLYHKFRQRSIAFLKKLRLTIMRAARLMVNWLYAHSHEKLYAHGAKPCMLTQKKLYAPLRNKRTEKRGKKPLKKRKKRIDFCRSAAAFLATLRQHALSVVFYCIVKDTDRRAQYG